MTVKKDSLLKGTLILALAALTARALGLFQRVPIEHLLGDQGNLYYSNANNVYLFMLVIATAGIPSAVSKMVSERYAVGRVLEAERIYRASLVFGAAAGMMITLLLLALAPVIAGPIMNEPGAAASIRAIAPSLLLFPMIAMMRGYFQGRQYMTAGGISQIVEQIARVIASIGLAFSLAAWGFSDERIAAGAAFGSVFGSIGAFLVMVWYARKLRAGETLPGRRGTDRAESRMRWLDIYRELFRLSVPVVLTAVTVQAMYMLDTMLIKPLLDGHFAPETIYRWGSVLGQNAQSFAGIPVILAVALSQSVIPVISSAHATGDRERVGSQASLAVRIALFSGMPVVLLISVGAYSVNGLLFSSDEGSPIVAMLTFGTIFQIAMLVTNSILLGIGQPSLAMKHAVTGILLKILLSFALAPWLGVYGLIAATTGCFAWVLLFNVLSLKKRTRFRVIERRKWLPFLLVAAATAAILWGVQWGVLGLLDHLPKRLAFFFSSAAMGAAVIAVYPALLVFLGVITAGDMQAYPRPVRKMLGPLIRLRGAAARGMAD